MRRVLLLLILILPLLLAACFPAAGVTTSPSPAAGVTGASPATSTPSVPAPPEASIPLIPATPSAGEVSTLMPEPTQGASPAALPDPVSAALAAAAQQLGLQPGDLTVVSYQAVQWPDACLGIVVPGRMCAQVITPGYRLVIRGPQGEFEVHTGRTGLPAHVVTPAAPEAVPPAPTDAAAPVGRSPRRSTSVASGIEGQALIGPLVPLQSDGESNVRPYQAAIDVLDQTGQIVTRFLTNAQGRFRVALAPGAYVVHPQAAGRFPHAADQPVTVRKGQFVSLTIEFDSGIR